MMDTMEGASKSTPDVNTEEVRKKIQNTLHIHGGDQAMAEVVEDGEENKTEVVDDMHGSSPPQQQLAMDEETHASSAQPDGVEERLDSMEVRVKRLEDFCDTVTTVLLPKDKPVKSEQKRKWSCPGMGQDYFSPVPYSPARFAPKSPKSSFGGYGFPRFHPLILTSFCPANKNSVPEPSRSSNVPPYSPSIYTQTATFCDTDRYNITIEGTIPRCKTDDYTEMTRHAERGCCYCTRRLRMRASGEGRSQQGDKES